MVEDKDAVTPQGSSLRLMALVCLFAVAVVVILGAYTRLVDAGLGCPDWPGCYGFILVPQAPSEIAAAQARFPDAPVEADKAWPEMVHRYFASGLGLLILITAVIAWRSRQQAPRVAGLTLALLAMVILQGAFGAWTVTLKLWPQVVTAHLLGGFTTLSLIWLLCLRLGIGRSWGLGSIPGIQALRGLAVLGLVLLVLQIALGGWVSSNYAALACPDFPTCQGEWLPPGDLAAGFNFTQTVGPNYLGGLMTSEARITIQVAHRIGALLVTLALGLLCLRLWSRHRGLALALGAALACQLTLGILNVVLVLPLWNATAHNAMAAVTLAVLITVNYAAWSTARSVDSQPFE